MGLNHFTLLLLAQRLHRAKSRGAAFLSLCWRVSCELSSNFKSFFGNDALSVCCFVKQDCSTTFIPATVRLFSTKTATRHSLTHTGPRDPHFEYKSDESQKHSSRSARDSNESNYFSSSELILWTSFLWNCWLRWLVIGSHQHNSLGCALRRTEGLGRDERCEMQRDKSPVWDKLRAYGRITVWKEGCMFVWSGVSVAETASQKSNPDVPQKWQQSFREMFWNTTDEEKRLIIWHLKLQVVIQQRHLFHICLKFVCLKRSKLSYFVWQQSSRDFVQPGRDQKLQNLQLRTRFFSSCSTMFCWRLDIDLHLSKCWGFHVKFEILLLSVATSANS